MYANAVRRNRLTILLDSLGRRFDKKTRITWLIVFLFLLFLYLWLVLWPFPDYQQVSEIELDDEFFETFEPPPIETIKPKERELKPESLEDSKVPSTEDIMEAFNFTEILNMDVSRDIIQEMDIIAETGGGIDDLIEEIDDVIEGTNAVGYEDFLKGDGDDVFFDDGLIGFKNQDESPGIKGATGTRLKSSGIGGGRGGGIGKGIGKGKAISDAGIGVRVALKNYGEDDYQGINIINPLIEWMRAHQRPHPPTMKAFLAFKSGDLTSIVNFSINKRPIEMYLRCTEQTKELAISIIEGANAIKLVDQGISERSHKLEIGTVVREEQDKRIVNVISENITPARSRTNEFMNIFLSWWNNGNPVD